VAPLAQAGDRVEELSWGFGNFVNSDYAHCCPADFNWPLYGESFIGAPSGAQLANTGDLLIFPLYKTKLARPGNCFGIALLSLLLNTKGGHLGFCGSPNLYSGDLGSSCNYTDENGQKTQSGSGPANPNLTHVINLVHGRQINLTAVQYLLDNLNHARDGNHAYDIVDQELQRGPGALALVSISDSVKSDLGGHTVVAYKTEYDQNANEKYIHVYNPNYPWKDTANQNYYLDGHHHDCIRIKATGANAGHWEFDFGWEPASDKKAETVTTWSGEPGGDLGGLGDNAGWCMAIPASIVAPKGRSVGSPNGAELKQIGSILLTGAGASVGQMTDSRGRRLLVPGTQTIETDPQAGIGTITPFFPTAGDGTSPLAQLYFALDRAADAFDTQINCGATGYQLMLGAVQSAVSVTTQSGAGGGDRIRVHGVGSDSPGATLFNPYGRNDYAIQFTQIINPSEHSRIFTVDGIVAARGVPIEFEVAQNQAALKVSSPMATARFNLHVSDLRHGAAQSADFINLTVASGQSALIGPSSWISLSNATPIGFSERLSSADIEGYADTLAGAAQGSSGPQFANARDVGGASGGQTTFDTNAAIYIQRASGTNIGNGGDSFQFAYTPMAGDFVCEVEIVAAPTNPGASYGLMARQDSSPTAKYSFLQPYSWTYRVNEGDEQSTDTTETFQLGPDATPRFLRLMRYGATFYGFASGDALTWQPVGADTWDGADPAVPLAVGFASVANGPPSTTHFKVRRFEALTAPPLTPITDEGVSPGTVTASYSFSEADGASPAGFSVQRRDGAFVPRVLGGRLRVTDSGSPQSSSSAFSMAAIQDVEAAIYQFDFDLFLTPPSGSSPAEGLTFTLLSGLDATPVGFAGGALGYQGLGHAPSTGQNISRNSVGIEFELGSGIGHNEGTGPFHVGIDAQNSISSLAVASNDFPSLLSSNGVHARIVYNRGSIGVFLRDASATDAALVKVLETTTLPLSYGQANGAAVFGFTGGTGSNGLTAEIARLVVRRIECNGLPNVALIAGAPQAPVGVGDIVTLDGSLSHSGATNTPQPVTFAWSVISSNASIVGPDFGPTVNIVPSAPGTVTVSLAVDDARCGTSGNATVSFEVTDALPLVGLGAARTAQGLALTWTNPGSNYLFTVETTFSLTHPEWVPAEGGSWPSNITQWIVPSLNSTSQFYRVMVTRGP
jgi:hypothetical protein